MNKATVSRVGTNADTATEGKARSTRLAKRSANNAVVDGKDALRKATKG